MTQTIEFKQKVHLDPALSDPATLKLNAGNMVGRWKNTSSETQGIAEILIEQEEGQVWVSVVAKGEGSVINWPRTQVALFANLEDEASQPTIALMATFNFGFMKAETHIRFNKGVLVMVLYNTFQDESGRSNYVTREFFYGRG